ncbi:MAG: FAD-binding oxidoreductase [Sphingopyxis sp.]|nr:FAD-binding oxidoreductase [Sphingopyxis sp.]
MVTGDDLAGRPATRGGNAPCPARALVRPADTSEVAAVVAACHAAGVAIVPQGGHTGLVHGADAAAGEVLLSLERMRAIGPVDTAQRVMIVEAGAILSEVQQAARDAGLLFPVDLGARGSATIGGMTATNAGGNGVLRHGMMRENISGLEAVLADGTIVDATNQLIKNNSGYDLKQLFIGSEGTLGIVTRIVLRLCELPSEEATALVALDRFSTVGELLRRLERETRGALTAFEVMWPDFYEAVAGPEALPRPPLALGHGYYVLVEAGIPSEELGENLANLLEEGLLADAVIASSEREREELWTIRDDVAQLRRFGSLRAYDISLRLADMEAYLADLRTRIATRWPGARLWAFGHLGDGNVHVAVHVPEDAGEVPKDLDALVYAPLQALGGAISAEHGIGTEKKGWLGISRTPAEIALMHGLKRALDPANILNPGRVIDAAPGTREGRS